MVVLLSLSQPATSSATVGSEDEPSWTTASALLLFGAIVPSTVNAALFLGGQPSAPVGVAGVILGGAAIVGGSVIALKYDTPRSDQASGLLLVAGAFSSVMGMFAIKHSRSRVSVEPKALSHEGRLEPGILLRIQF